MEANQVMDPEVAYNTPDDRSILSIISFVRNGIKFPVFLNFVKRSPFSISEWSVFLHLSERTMQRYEREKKQFDSLQSEKIMDIALFYKRGIAVMGSAEKFNQWLEAENMALGKQKPKSFLDNSFGINLLRDELTRIEHGIFA